MAENKDMTGVLFRNDRKENDKHPDRKGSALIDGIEYWVAGWLKEGKNGQFLSLAFTVKDAGSVKPKVNKTAQGLRDDDPLPF